MSFFAIRNRATGEFLPVGGTREDFSATKPPRLFRLKSHAQAALDRWREGVWHNNIDQYGEGPGPEPSRTKFNEERSAKRKAMDVHVCELTVELRVL